MPTPAASACSGPLNETGWPKRRSWPESAEWMPARIFPSVLLPAPFSPHNAWHEPAAISSETSLSACTPGKRRVIFSKRTAGSVMRCRPCVRCAPWVRCDARGSHLQVYLGHVGESPVPELPRPLPEVLLRDADEIHGDDGRDVFLGDDLVDDGVHAHVAPLIHGLGEEDRRDALVDVHELG